MNLNLKGKTALVCGSTQGIGKATAIELALLDADVVLFARNESKLQQVLEELDKSKGQNHNYLVADFSDTELVKTTVQTFVEQNPVHILVNNTGGPAGGPIINAEDHAFLSAFQQHLINNHNILKALVPGMRSVGYGRVINIISTSVKQPLTGLGVSNTIRGAVASWAKTMANELGQFGITVNNVLPGATMTARLESIAENKAKASGLNKDEILNQMAAATPAKRIGQANEVANAVAFLASPAAGYINGINLPVDGGRTGSL
ncbi:MAG: short-chain dehydrogenase [Bacteroidetes bacterium]|nr:MAG: short-chain dehydrogenase [Bacteroidota bacterium]